MKNFIIKLMKKTNYMMVLMMKKMIMQTAAMLRGNSSKHRGMTE